MKKTNTRARGGLSNYEIVTPATAGIIANNRCPVILSLRENAGRDSIARHRFLPAENKSRD
jgi:hypothetical protein